MDNILADLNVVVDRKTWYRGKSGYSSKLLKNDGRMCCLGFAAIADGAQSEDIIDIGDPGGIDIPNILNRCLIYGWKKENSTTNNPTTTKLMIINDDENINDSEREAKLIEIGKEIGINFSFVG